MEEMPPACLIAFTLVWMVGTISPASIGSTTLDRPMPFMCIGTAPPLMLAETSSPGTRSGRLKRRFPAPYSKIVRWLWSLRTRKS